MKLNKSIFFGLTLLCLVFVISASCKKCNTAEKDLATGIIVSTLNEDEEEQVILYPSIGFTATTLFGGNALVTAPSPFCEFEVSFDGGATRQLLDFNQYYLLSQPMNVGCNTSFERDVTVNGGLVVYKVTASTCNSCEQEYHVENWVLVPASAIPGGATVSFQSDLIQL